MSERIGSIVISNGKILVTVTEQHRRSTAEYDSVSIENIEDAARILGRLMSAPSENIHRECQRIHDNDQFDAWIRNSVTNRIP